MGCSTFANFTVLPEIAVAKIREDAPFDKVCYIGCGVTTGIGAVINTAKVEAGANVVVFGLGGIGLNVVQGARMVGANMIVGVDVNPAREALARKFGLTHFVNPNDVKEDLVAHLVALTGGGADYSFECVGNVGLMRQALECCHRGWGVSVIIGVAGSGQEIATRPFQLVTGRVWKGTAFGGARGRTDVPKIVDWYMDGKINIDDLITHVLPLDTHQRRVRFDARGYVDPGCGNVLSSLADLVETSERVAADASRRAKTAHIAQFLRAVAPDEVEIAVAYLSGFTRQGKTGIGYAMLRDTRPAAHAATPALALARRRCGARADRDDQRRGIGQAQGDAARPSSSHARRRARPTSSRAC